MTPPVRPPLDDESLYVKTVQAEAKRVQAELDARRKSVWGRLFVRLFGWML